MPESPFTPDVVARLERIATEYGAENVRVFGSFARGDATSTSDIDLLVDFPAERGGFSFVRFCEAVAALFARPVDVLTERSLPAALRRKVLDEAKPVALLA